ncbi:hypothetical protein THASP1DRAFT_32754 [Thamnocephalis sphaerospora]|uniref:Uncharacterized protein n=1 Tax=Thamnocephalis sphaerospora TaxID=78915 RepID=A0A4P9XI96_9FUNG|nr:hypothetical protein THASP1DRAFT_32754 [Thamnocephalis sphaerospora]|eukprot:RKP05404.1 hypothetical protein THASP1DRAFT_32754 [Thamnocephalis sphaerospora]
MLSTNVFCMFMAAFITDVPISAIFYPIDWTIISLLLVAHIKNMRMSAKYSKTPHTTYVMKDFSKIEARVSSIITHS